MSKLVWTIAWFLVALWSAIAALTWWVIDSVTGIAARHADQLGTDPESVEWINTVAIWLQSFGSAATLVVWAVVAAGILALAWLVAKFAGNSSSSAPLPPARP